MRRPFRKKTLGVIGYFLSRRLKILLAEKWAPLRYLLYFDKEFIYRSYLGNLSVTVDPKNFIELFMLNNLYEPDVFAAIKTQVKPGDVCLDIGANVGAISLALCQQVGPMGRIYCIEPGPPFFKRLKANFDLNPQFKERALFFPIGLSRERSELYWTEDPSLPGNGFLSQSGQQKVAVETLDDFVEQNYISKIDLVKIDVEGMELDILQGATETLTKFRPKILIETLMGKHLEIFLQNAGYKFYRVDNMGELQPVHYPNFSANSLAVYSKSE